MISNKCNMRELVPSVGYVITACQARNKMSEHILHMCVLAHAPMQKNAAWLHHEHSIEAPALHVAAGQDSSAFFFFLFHCFVEHNITWL